ncbi:hypothetical protein [Lysobacter capsici]|uniref:hypothetical protein n=1 Tax=Lysobacter capsici TaxID=435897 RepID=UPI000AC8A182|nr:hypothetical protein [Lysobacter capsici]
MTASSSRSSNDGSHGHGHGARAPSRLTSLLYAACIVVAVALVIVPNSSKTNLFVAPVGEPRVATAAEQRAIVIAVVEHQRSVAEPSTFDASGVRYRLALENVTLSICAKPRQNQEGCRLLAPERDEGIDDSRNLPGRPIDPNLSRQLVNALRRFNVGQRPLDTRSVPGTVSIGREQVTAMFEAVGKQWNLHGIYQRDVYQTYLQASGILRVSRPVVSPGGDRALLYVETTYDPSKVIGQMELFALRQGRWTFVGVVGSTQMEIT